MPKILDLRTIGDREVGRYAHQQLVQRQSLRSERGEIAQLDPGEIAQLRGIRYTGEHMLGAKYGRQVQQVAWDLRLDAGIPRPECDWCVAGAGKHGQ